MFCLQWRKIKRIERNHILWIIACNHRFMWICTMLSGRSTSKTTSALHLRRFAVRFGDLSVVTHTNYDTAYWWDKLLPRWLFMTQALLKIQSAYGQAPDTFTYISSRSPPLIHTRAVWQWRWAQEVLCFTPAVCWTLEQVGQREFVLHVWKDFFGFSGDVRLWDGLDSYVFLLFRLVKGNVEKHFYWHCIWMYALYISHCLIVCKLWHLEQCKYFSDISDIDSCSEIQFRVECHTKNATNCKKQ